MWRKFIPLVLLLVLLSAVRFGHMLPLFLWNDAGMPTPHAEETLGVAEDGEPIRVEAYFSHPQSFLHPFLDLFFVEGDSTFETKVGNLFHRAVPGSEIHAVLYEFDSDIVAEEMARAKSSGVTVDLVMDDSARDWISRPTYERLRQDLGDSHVHVCSRGACIGSGNNHNKIYLFSEVRDPRQSGKTLRHVVVQTSENLGFWQRYFFNDMVILYNDKAIYDAYLNYWHDLHEERPNPAFFEGPHGTALSEATGTRVYFFPSARNDPIIDQLRTVSCAGGGRIFVAQSLYNGKAAEDLTNELVRLQREGCSVDAVLHKNESDNHYVDELAASGIEVSYLESIHSKIVMINALQDVDGNRERARIVFTGSLNRKESALRNNDETLLRIVSRHVFDGYWTYMLNLQGRSFR
jgi:hypothetical protein